MLCTVPIPEAAEADAGPTQAAIDRALAEADAQGISGRETTPFLLKRVCELTDGASLESNIALIKNNAAAGAELAVELARIRRLRGGSGEASPSSPPASAASARPVVVGGLVADLVASPASGTALLPRTSNPGSLSFSPGGVGRNIAEGLARLGAEPLLISAVGDDPFGAQLLSHAASISGAGAHLNTGGVRPVSGGRTATFTAMMDGDGDLFAAVADMEIHNQITPDHICAFGQELMEAPLCVADANLADEALQALARFTGSASTPLWLEPVSVPKAAAACRSLLSAGLLAQAHLHVAQRGRGDRDGGDAPAGGVGRRRDDPPTEARSAAAALVRAGCRHVLVTRGERGVLWARRDAAASPETGAVVFEELSALPVPRVVSTRGAGDSFVAGAAWQLCQRGAGAHASAARAAPEHTDEDVAAVRAAIEAGLRAARLNLGSFAAISEEMAPELLLSPSSAS